MDIAIRQRRWRTAVATGVLLLVGVGLSGCAQQAVAALDRPATDADSLPVMLADAHGFVASSARKVASQDGVDYFLAWQGGDAPAASVCLIVYPTVTPTQWSMGCSEGDRMGVTSASGRVTAEFIRQGVTPDDVKTGWTRVAENIVVQG